MDINEVVRIAMLVLNFVVSNWETIALLPLVVYYIRNKMWDKLFALAVKEGMKFKDVDKTVIKGEEIKENVVAVMKQTVSGKFYNKEELEEISKIAYKLKVKE
jgi:hypothetical protein